MKKFFGLKPFVFLLMLISVNLSYADEVNVVEVGGGLSFSSISYENGFEVIIASNPALEKSAASLFIHSGYYDDPENIDEVAHLVEHSFHHIVAKKNEDFLTSMQAMGGTYYAQTSGQTTRYDLSFENKYLKDVLSFFVRFLSVEKMNDSMLSQELKVIEQEHKDRLQQPWYGMRKLFGKISNPEHPYHRIHRLKTHVLAKENPQLLLDQAEVYFNKFYQVNNATLFLATNQSAPEAIKTIRRNTKALSQRATPAIQPTEERPLVFDLDAHLEKKKIFVGADHFNDAFLLSFPMNKNYSYDFEMFSVLNKFLNRKGSGSLHSYLVNQGFIESLESDVIPLDHGQNMFLMSFTLTKEGKKHTELIERAFYEYVSSLEKDEYLNKNIHATMDYREKNFSGTRNGNALISYFFNHIENDPFYVKKYLKSLKADRTGRTHQVEKDLKFFIHTVLKGSPISLLYLNQDNHTKGKDFPFKEDETGLSYNIVSYKQEGKKIFNSKSYFSLGEPLLAPAIDSDAPGESNIVPALQIENVPGRMVWYKSASNKTNLVNMSIKISPSIVLPRFEQSLMERMLSKELALRLGNIQNTLAYVPFSIEANSLINGGIAVSVIVPSIYHEKVLMQLYDILDVETFNLNKKRTDILYSLVLSQEKDILSEIGYQYPGRLMSHLMHAPVYHLSPSLSSEEVHHHYKTFKQGLSKSFHTIFIHGNVTEEKSLAIAHSLSNSLRGKLDVTHQEVIFAPQYARGLWDDKPATPHIPYIPKLPENASLTVAHYLLPEKNMRNIALLHLLKYHMQIPFFYYMRELERPGYSSYVNWHDLGLQFISFSGEKEHEESLKEIDAFIHKNYKDLNIFSFYSKKRLALNYESIEKMSFIEASRDSWSYIVYPEFGPGFLQELKEELSKIKYSEFKQFYKKYLLQASPENKLVFKH